MSRVVDLRAKNEEIAWEKSLRPVKLDEYIGQSKIKDNLDIFLKASLKRGTSLDHLLLHGPPGLGKTTLAYVIANERGVNIKATSGPAILKPGDLAGILTSLEHKDILFIDEIHRLPRIVEEILYPAMEDFSIDLMVGKGPGARSIKLELNRFTLIGATTRASLLSSPLRDRFGTVFHLNFYEVGEVEQIILRSSQILNARMEGTSSDIIASRSRRTPRIANRLLRRLIDFAQVKGDGTISEQIALEALDKLGVDNLGLDIIDRDILSAIAQKFYGGPVGIETISAATGQDKNTIEDMYEPFWLQMGLIQRTPRGRTLTQHGFEHLGLKYKAEPSSLALPI